MSHRELDRLQVIVGALLLIVAIGFLIVSAFDKVWFRADIDLDKPGWVLLGVGIYTLLGLRLSDFVSFRTGDEGDDERDR